MSRKSASPRAASFVVFFSLAGSALCACAPARPAANHASSTPAPTAIPASAPTAIPAPARGAGAGSGITSAPPNPAPPGRTADDDRRLAAALKAELFERILPFWFPRTVDERAGGFFQTIKSDGTIADDGGKFLVFQARMTWVAAQVARRYPERRAEYLRYVRHGLDFLENRMADPGSGGLFFALDAKGAPVSSEKHAYGISFAMYAAAAAARVTQSAGDRAFASSIFAWLDDKAHDRAHGGYYEALANDGTPILSARGRSENDAIGTPYGHKSMNTHIHLLEALIELHRVAPSSRVEQRLAELLTIVRDRIADDRGFFHLYFTPDWAPLPGRESYGHEVEGAFLLLEAENELGGRHDEKTELVAKRLVDHALTHGWDSKNGGFFNEGDPDGAPLDRRKVWWVQAEGLNGLLAADELEGGRTRRYFDALQAQWHFIDTRVSDHQSGEWWGYLGPRGELIDPAQEKGNRWKTCYHASRALMIGSERLEKLATELE